MNGFADRVVVAGGGPTGLVTALSLAKQGIPVLLLEAQKLPHDHRRATTFHPPTLEYLDALGVLDAVLDNGRITPVWQFRDRHAGCVAEFDLAALNDETPHPYRVQCEQYNLNHALYRSLRDSDGVELLMGARAVDATQDADGVTVTVVLADGGREDFGGRFLVAADGARSAVRRQLDVPFDGFTYEQKVVQYGTQFDISEAIPDVAGVAYISDPDEWCVLLHLDDYWRVTFSARSDEDDDAAMTDDVAEARMAAFLGTRGAKLALHRNVWRIHQRVADTMRVGRILLAGDAAHINSPIGGMGMNSGVHDAVNAADKLGKVWRREGEIDLLDRYSRQRRHVALADVREQTVRNTRFLNEKDRKVRAESQKKLREVAADPVKAHDYMMRSAMISGLREANALA